MSLFSEWQKRLENQEGESQEFFENYLKKEKEAYQRILGTEDASLSGKLSDLAEFYAMDTLTFIGFLDGISTSLDTELDLDSLTEASDVTLDINKEKLYYNMLNAKADWLYGLEEWNSHLTNEQKAEIKKHFHEDNRAVSSKVGRNDPCPCGSGKKYKKCCG